MYHSKKISAAALTVLFIAACGGASTTIRTSEDGHEVREMVLGDASGERAFEVQVHSDRSVAEDQVEELMDRLELVPFAEAFPGAEALQPPELAALNAEQEIGEREIRVVLFPPRRGRATGTVRLARFIGGSARGGDEHSPGG